MKACRFLLFGLLLLLGRVVHAEGGCPPGMIPASGTDINSCVPVPPGYYRNQQQAQPQLPLPPPPQWVTRWGAIATDAIKGIVGAVTGLSSKNEAQQAAMADCRAKGGSLCKLEIAYDNECVTLAADSMGYSINTGNTVDAANQLAMKTCSAIGEHLDCHVYYSACSLPVRIQ
ncbi:DUF4189 domain-containing protein [Rhodanobacter glycinis]|uniref:DUF4189 domain-containing protein n=1 Tax=Rhodanobacter glycinis TaxID=582702 RepID=A0A502CDN6_9GAMM|nr:DUF4189 domain-containing protein [Rhodanobacter glycinis]TPG11785.1 DUF4189 domain-containing protein [Rhodanobacter glycinis]TPG47361.1 DUF4189 domain-containing protein [Rhodanobacter glycinis]